jgi:hypothetical protein
VQGHIPDDKTQVTEEEAVWMSNHTLLDTLGPEGMSSDESEVDDAGNRTYRVKIMDWRNRDIVRKVVEIDKDRNTTNAYGNTRAGNPPRLRKRWEDGRKTSRKAPPHLPINFYNAQWYASLKPGQKRELGAGPEVVLL